MLTIITERDFESIQVHINEGSMQPSTNGTRVGCLMTKELGHICIYHACCRSVFAVNMSSQHNNILYITL